MLDFDILSWFIGIIILVFTLIVFWQKKRNVWFMFCFSIFWIYLLLAIKETIFPIPLGRDISDRSFISQINLMPLYFGKSTSFFSIRAILIASILNIILTIPFGFGINFIAQFKARDFTWLAITVGIGIELAQLIISLIITYPYRTIDINDVLLNAIGVWIGYIIFKIFAWLYIASTQKLGITHKGLFAYIYDTVSKIYI